MVVAHRPTEQILSNSSKAQVSTCLTGKPQLIFLRENWLLHSSLVPSLLPVFQCYTLCNEKIGEPGDEARFTV